MKIVVIGAGGTASYLIPVLMNSIGKDDHVVVMDGDRVEAKNLNRQLFNERDIGRNKAEALAKTYRSPRFGKNITALPEFLRDVPMFLDIHGDLDLVIACPDNHPARMRCLDVSDTVGCPAIICGNGLDCASASIYWPVNKGTGADPRVMFPDLANTDAPDTTMSCTGEYQEENKQVAIANNKSAAQALCIFYQWFQAPSPEASLRNSQPFLDNWAAWGTSPTVSVEQAIDFHKEQLDLLNEEAA